MGKQPDGYRAVFLEKGYGSGLEERDGLVEQQEAEAHGHRHLLLILKSESLACDGEIARDLGEMRAAGGKEPASWHNPCRIQYVSHAPASQYAVQLERLMPSPIPPALDTSAARVPLEIPNIGALTIIGFWAWGNHEFKRDFLPLGSSASAAALLTCPMIRFCLF